MLVYKNNTDVVWNGEPINDVRHPKDIETKWSVEELSAIGLEVKVPVQEVVEAPTKPEVVETLDEAKKRYTDLVNQDAEIYRMKFITQGFGMSLTYAEKRRQAEEIIALGETATSNLTTEQVQANYPTLSASVGKEADTLYECAELVITQRDAFLQLSGYVEDKRLQAKKDIAEAVSVDDIKTIYNVITWS